MMNRTTMTVQMISDRRLALSSLTKMFIFPIAYTAEAISRLV